MNNLMAEQLLEAGLVSQEKYQEHVARERDRAEAEKQKQVSRLTAKSRRPANFDRLETATSASDFKRVALEILQENPDVMDDVINAAHGLKNKPGGKKLVWLMYQIRDGLSQITDKGERKRFLKRALRRAGNYLCLPTLQQQY